jgi:ribosomal protein S12 methylthiotransferase
LNRRNVHIISLGCPKNLVDSEVMAALLAKSGYRITAQADEAHIILINTCAFILSAKEESIDEILKIAEWKKQQKGACTHLVVTGCLPQRYGKALERELPEVDLFLGVGEIGNIVHHLNGLTQTEEPGRRSIVGKPTFLMNAQTPRLISTPFFTSYLKIAEGCSSRCSYCVIPTIRGKARSREMEDILMEAESLSMRGVKEVIITAQDTTAYGRDLKGKLNLADLLGNLASIKGIRWIRLLYINPANLTEEILKSIADNDNICHYIDIPIQHIDDEILASMKRRSSSDLIKKTIRQAREMIPNAALRTSIIVGFPGETRARFNKLLSFIKQTRFDHLGVFTYSREEGTKAASYPSRISETEKEARRELLMEEQSIISYQINQALIGSTQEVLIEGKSEIPLHPYVGRCRRQAPDIDGVTYVEGKSLAAGSLLSCKITATTEYDLFAEALP